jgi:hypothetical protein
MVNGRLGVMWKKELFYIFKIKIQNFPEMQGGVWTAVHIPPCTGNKAHTNT